MVWRFELSLAMLFGLKTDLRGGFADDPALVQVRAHIQKLV